MQSVLDTMCAMYGFGDQERSCFERFSDEILTYALRERRNTKGTIRTNFGWLKSKCIAREKYLETTKHVGLIAAFGHKNIEKKLDTKTQRDSVADNLYRRLKEIEDPTELERKLLSYMQGEVFLKLPHRDQSTFLEGYNKIMVENNRRIQEQRKGTHE